MAYVCSGCGRQFAHYGNVDRHIRRPWLCRVTKQTYCQHEYEDADAGQICVRCGKERYGHHDE